MTAHVGEMPTLLLYALATWCLYTFIVKLGMRVGLTTIAHKRVLTVTAGATTAIVLGSVGFLVPYRYNIPVRETAAMLRAEDRVADGPIVLPSIVAIVTPDAQIHSSKFFCDTLCQRLLFNGAVSRVIIAREPIPAARTHWPAAGAFWIEKRDKCLEPDLNYIDMKWPGDVHLKGGETSKTRARARAVGGECLVQGPGRIDESQAMMVFSNVKTPNGTLGSNWNPASNTLRAQRLEIVEAGGHVLYRGTEVIYEQASMPLAIDIYLGLFGIYFGLSRNEVTENRIGSLGSELLPILLGNAVRAPEPAGR